MRDLEELQKLIDGRDEPVTVFFRNDDAGWANERLVALCDRFSACGVSLDLAVIPGALDGGAQEPLYKLLQQHGPLLHLHQHGYFHSNHQQSGRKCEFGDERRFHQQRRDIAAGQHRLHAIFGELIEPVFTPPWNRCTADCCQALTELDFTVLSRIVGSDEIDHVGLADVSVSIDWQKKRNGIRLSGADFHRYAAKQIERQSVIGIMLHHETMDDAELDHLTLFLQDLQDSSNAELKTILEVGELKQPEINYREHACN